MPEEGELFHSNGLAIHVDPVATIRERDSARRLGHPAPNEVFVVDIHAEGEYKWINQRSIDEFMATLTVDPILVSKPETSDIFRGYDGSKLEIADVVPGPCMRASTFVPSAWTRRRTRQRLEQSAEPTHALDDLARSQLERFHPGYGARAMTSERPGDQQSSDGDSSSDEPLRPPLVQRRVPDYEAFPVLLDVDKVSATYRNDLGAALDRFLRDVKDPLLQPAPMKRLIQDWLFIANCARVRTVDIDLEGPIRFFARNWQPATARLDYEHVEEDIAMAYPPGCDLSKQRFLSFSPFGVVRSAAPILHRGADDRPFLSIGGIARVHAYLRLVNELRNEPALVDVAYIDIPAFKLEPENVVPGGMGVYEERFRRSTVTERRPHGHDQRAREEHITDPKLTTTGTDIAGAAADLIRDCISAQMGWMHNDGRTSPSFDLRKLDVVYGYIQVHTYVQPFWALPSIRTVKIGRVRRGKTLKVDNGSYAALAVSSSRLCIRSQRLTPADPPQGLRTLDPRVEKFQ